VILYVVSDFGTRTRFGTSIGIVSGSPVWNGVMW